MLLVMSKIAPELFSDESLAGLRGSKPLRLDSKVWRLLGKVFWNFIKYYGLKQNQAAGLLSLSSESRKTLKEFEENQNVPHTEEIALRIIQLLSINKNLALLYPHNKEIIETWMRTPKSFLHEETPIDHILKGPGLGPLTRIFEVRRILDQIRVR